MNKLQDVDRCVKCGHRKVDDGPCIAHVPICSDDYHGMVYCGCKCEFPSTSVSEAEDKNSGSAGKRHRAVPSTESQATSELDAALSIVETWSHPDWDMALTFESNPENRDVGMEHLADSDPKLLTVERGYMTRKELDGLPEWDG